MSLNVNLDALIQREDFEVKTENDDAQISQTIQIRDLEKNAFFFGALRKPDFQRETSEWNADKVVKLIDTFINGELIPAIILWKNRDLVFVIDGSHRLSALIAWVQNDFGDGEYSRKFFDNRIPDEQQKAAERTRTAVEKAIGTYESHKAAIENPDQYGPEFLSRSRRLGSLAIQLQWVRGDAAKAEDSFIRINQQAAIISPQEMELIKSRKKPNTIASRAIIRCGTGHEYWSEYSQEIKNELTDLATEVFNLMFEPKLKQPIKTIDLPAGGSEYSSTALSMIHDFINICIGTPTDKDDQDGVKTIDYLKRTKRVMQLILSNHPSSLGLHPAIYFYSWTGKQQPILFLVVVDLILEMEKRKKLPEFIKCREALENFIVNNRSLINQIVRKFGSKSSGRNHLRAFYSFLLEKIEKSMSNKAIVEALKKDSEFSFLQPDEVPYGSKAPSSFSSKSRAGVIISELLDSSIRCSICGGFVPTQAMSVDHIIRKSEGGVATSENAQVVHPYCNTGIKS